MKEQEVGAAATLGADRSQWRRVKFADVVVCTNETSRNPLADGLDRFVGLEHLEPHDFRIAGYGNVADGTTFTRVFRAGQVLFGKRRAYQRKAAVADFDGICSGDILVFAAKADVLHPDLLPFVVQSDGFFEKAIGTSAGSLSPRTKWSELAQYEFDLPPLDEQRRIAEVLWAVEGNLDSWNKVKHEIDCINLFDFDRFGYEEDLHQTKLGTMPISWQIKPLAEIANFLDNRRVPVKDSERAKCHGQYPYYGATGVIDHVDGYLYDEPLLLVSEDGANLVDRNYPVVYRTEGKIWVNNHSHVLSIKDGFSRDFYAIYIRVYRLQTVLDW